MFKYILLLNYKTVIKTHMQPRGHQWLPKTGVRIFKSLHFSLV